MKFKCPGCKEILNVDMRITLNKQQVSKKGFHTYCDLREKFVYCKPVKGVK